MHLVLLGAEIVQRQRNGAVVDLQHRVHITAIEPFTYDVERDVGPVLVIAHQIFHHHAPARRIEIFDRLARTRNRHRARVGAVRPDTSVRCPILSTVAARAEPITQGAASAVHPPVAPTNSSRRDRLFGRIIHRPPCAFVAAQHLPVVDPVQTLPIASQARPTATKALRSNAGKTSRIRVIRSRVQLRSAFDHCGQNGEYQLGDTIAGRVAADVDRVQTDTGLL